MAPRTTIEVPTLGTPRILLADSDADIRARYHAMFAAAGCIVVDAADGHEALVHALVRRPTLILTSLNLPVLDGIALCEVLRRDQSTSDVPIVVITTETRPAELDRARQAGANVVLTQPVAPEQLWREARRLLADGRRAPAPSEHHPPERRELAKSVARPADSAAERRTSSISSPILRNRLLAALPVADRQRITAVLKPVRMAKRQVLYKPGEAIRQVYFPNGGLYSIVAVLLTGTLVEVASVGDEGMLGVEAFLDDRPVALAETVLQMPDTNALAMSVADFRKELGYGALHRAVERYASVLLAQVMQSAACNALHSVRQRCARWLLMTADRVHQAEFELPREFLAAMLGVTRPTLGEVAAALQHDRLISYARRRMQVIDRKRLEAESCECYAITRARFDELLDGLRPRPSAQARKTRFAAPEHE